NNVISQRGKVPLIADMMVSRWAFEAMAVHQFTDNDYESSFYKYNKEQSQANIKAGFLAEELRRRNAFVKANFASTNDSIRAIVRTDLEIIHKALAYESFSGAADLAKALETSGYFEEFGVQFDNWLEGYRKHYLKVYNDSENVINKLMAFHEKTGWSVNEYKNEYFNESLNDLLRNVQAGDPVVEYRGELVQQLDPIFQSPTPVNAGDYRTGFFLPEKNFWGQNVSTFFFNVLTIWVMCLVLYTTLAARLPQRLTRLTGR
ncbi:MAG TPA: ABC transporter, partial [Cyclobacteriaceae bacterium]|nr:ABC transporter [Cyclobacteriaceae bacterium]